MATKTYSLNIDVNTKTLGELENELAQINEELKSVDRNSQAFKDLAAQSQAVTKEINKANSAIEGFTAEDKFQAADGAIKVFGGSLQTVVGTLGAFGVESEVFGEFEKQAASVIAVGMGLKDLSEGLKQVSDAYKKSGIAAKLFGSTAKKALIATGIGAFVVALGTVVAYWDEITEAISGASKEQKNLLETQKESVTASENAYSALTESENILKLQGKSEREIRDLKIQQLKVTLENLQAQLISQEEIRKAQVKTAEANKTIAQNIIRLVTLPITVALKGVDMLTQKLADLGLLDESYVTNLEQSFSGGIAGLIFNPEKIDEEGQKAKEETENQIRQIQNTIAGFELQTKAEDDAKAKEDADKKAVDTQKQIDDEKQKQEKLAALRKEIRDAEANTEEEQRALQLTKIGEYYDALITQAQEFGISTVELEASRREALAAQQAEYDEADKEARDRKLQEELDAAQTAFDEKMRLKRMELENAEVFVQGIAGLTNQETAIGKAAFLAQQALALRKLWLNFQEMKANAAKAAANASINSAEAGTEIAKGSSKALATLNPLVIAGYAISAIAVVASMVKAVKSVKKEASRFGAGGGSTPSFGTVPSAPGNLSAQEQPVRAPQSFDVQPTVKAYVVSGDVRSAEEVDARLRNRRTVS